MKIDLNAQESKVLENVLNSALTVVQQEAASEKNEKILERLHSGAEVIQALRTRLPHLDMNLREAHFLRDVLRSTIQAFSQGEIRSADFTEQMLKDLDQKVSFKSVHLSSEQRLAFSVVLENALRTLAELLHEESEEKESLETGHEALLDLKKRLESVELGEREASFLQSVLKVTANSLENFEKEMEGEKLAFLKLNQSALSGLSSKVASPTTSLSDEERYLLTIVLERTIPAIELECAKEEDPSVILSLGTGEKVMRELFDRIQSIEVTAREATLLGQVTDFVVQAIEAQYGLPSLRALKSKLAS